MKKYFLILLICVGLFGFLGKTEADATIYIDNEITLDDGEATIKWRGYSDQFSYEIGLADNPDFMNANLYSSDTLEVTIPQADFGEHGGKFYLRIRAVCCDPERDDYGIPGDWGATVELIFVKIDKTNFPGMYKLIKNGATSINIITGAEETIIFDKNEDGWLDPVEAGNVYQIITTDRGKMVNGKHKLIKATSVSSFDGIEYFPNLNSLQIYRYSGKKADLSNCTAKNIYLHRFTAKQLTVVAPNAKTIYFREPLKDNATLNLGKCSSAEEIGVIAETNNEKGLSKLTLPKETSNLKDLTLYKVHVSNLNLNSYTNLEELYLYRCNTKTLKVNKCKQLQYLYICECKKMNSLNLKSNKNLIGADFYNSPGLTKKTVKKSTSGTYTWNKGDWWTYQ